MGFLKSVFKTSTSAIGLDKAADFVGDKLLGGDAADAARQASQAQQAAAGNSIAFQRESRDLARSDLAPFVGFGQGNIDPLSQLLTPEGQANYLQANPLFQMFMDKANKASLSSNAAQGLLNSGNTLNELSTNAMMTGMPFLQNQQNQLFNAVNMGQSSAAGQANTALTTGNMISDLMTQQGNAQAAGIVGAQGARQAGINNLLSLGGQAGAAYLGGMGGGGAASGIGGGSGMAGFSDRRLKRQIEKVGQDDIGNLYRFKYIDSEQQYEGRMADELQKVRPDAVFMSDNGFFKVTDEFAPRAV